MRLACKISIIYPRISSIPTSLLRWLVHISIKAQASYFPIGLEKLKDENKVLYDIVLKRIGRVPSSTRSDITTFDFLQMDGNPSFLEIMFAKY